MVPEQDIVERVAVIFSDKNEIPIEKFVFRLKVNQSYRLDFLENDLEYDLRAFLIKLSASGSMLQPLSDGMYFVIPMVCILLYANLGLCQNIHKQILMCNLAQ